MEKRNILPLYLIIILLILTQSGCAVNSAKPAPAPQATPAPIHLEDLPTDLEIPSELPTTIHDPKLLGAWIQLYNRPNPIFQWDGSLLTGKTLAKLILDQSIPVLWDAEKKCGGAGCSIRHCDEQGCNYQDTDVEPIYIHPVLRDDPNALLGTLAHELYHRLEPFGGVRDTLFEEYCAYAVEVQLSGANSPKFGIFDPLVPADLHGWFHHYQIDDKYQIENYPAAILPLVKGTNAENTRVGMLDIMATAPEGQGNR
jgi:hypothetical protein